MDNKIRVSSNVPGLAEEIVRDLGAAGVPCVVGPGGRAAVYAADQPGSTYTVEVVGPDGKVTSRYPGLTAVQVEELLATRKAPVAGVHPTGGSQ